MGNPATDPDASMGAATPATRDFARARGDFNAARNNHHQVRVEISVNVSIDDIAALGPERANAFMTGIAKCVAAGNRLNRALRVLPSDTKGSP